MAYAPFPRLGRGFSFCFAASSQHSSPRLVAHSDSDSVCRPIELISDILFGMSYDARSVNEKFCEKFCESCGAGEQKKERKVALCRNESLVEGKAAVEIRTGPPQMTRGRCVETGSSRNGQTAGDEASSAREPSAWCTERNA